MRFPIQEVLKTRTSYASFLAKTEASWPNRNKSLARSQSRRNAINFSRVILQRKTLFSKMMKFWTAIKCTPHLHRSTWNTSLTLYSKQSLLLEVSLRNLRFRFLCLKTNLKSTKCQRAATWQVGSAKTWNSASDVSQRCSRLKRKHISSESSFRIRYGGSKWTKI